MAVKITAQRLRELLDYDPVTGVFTWRVHRRGHARARSLAGHTGKLGYVGIKLDGSPYQAHRLAWLHVHGVWPIAEIDHINGITADNRIVNLREATHAENIRNQKIRSNNITGYKGVSFHKKCNKWQAQIKVGDKRIHLGTFGTAQEASAAYEAVAITHFGNFKRA